MDDFSPREMKYFNFSQSSVLPELSTSAFPTDNGDVQDLPDAARNAWFAAPQSAFSGVGHKSFSTQFVSGIQKQGSDSLNSRRLFQDANFSKQSYDCHCFLPAASQDSRLIKVDFVLGLVLAFYGQSCGDEGAEKCVCAVGMAVYCVDSRSYSYVR